MNDVRRALLFWPAFTSALIILITLISPMHGDFLQDETWRSLSSTPIWSDESDSTQVTETKAVSDPEPTVVEAAQIANASKLERPKVMHSSIATPPTQSRIVERADRGQRAMQLPDRVASLFSRPNETDSISSLRDARDLYSATQIRTRSQESVPQIDDWKPVLRSSGDQLPEVTSDQDEEISLNPANAIGHAEKIEIKDIAAATPSPTVDSPSAIQLPNTQLPGTQPSLESLSAPSERPRIDSHTSNDRNLVIAALESLSKQLGEDTPSTPVLATPPATEPQKSIMPKSIANLAKIVPRSEELSRQQSKPQVPDLRLSTPNDQAARVESDRTSRNISAGNPSTWPRTPQLDVQLQDLNASAGGSNDDLRDEVTKWSTQVQQTFARLNELPRLGDPIAIGLISRLEALALDGLRSAEQVADRDIQINWLQATHGVYRRYAVWKAVWSVVSTTRENASSELHADNGRSVEEVVRQLRAEIEDTGDAAGWTSYLMLDQVDDAATGKGVNRRGMVAQRVLSRVRWYGLDDVQRAWLERQSIQQLMTELQPWTRAPVDYASLLSQIERQESDAVDLATIDIAGAAQTLRFSDSQPAAMVANQINTYYRNANIRTALSQEMLQRLIPSVAPVTVPVRTNILGSRVKGISHINSELDLELHPKPQSWAFTLQTIGNVRTHSTGRRGQTAVRTRGDANFAAATPIEITANGISVGDSQINVRGNTRLRDVNSQYDNWPLLGSLAKSIIAAKYNERSRLTSRIANRRMTKQIGDGIDERLDAKVAKATNRLNEVVMGPLNTLRLQPQIIDMQTTDQRLIARYRLAGDWQIGASTPRPRAPSDSLLSVQINQSAINNTLEQVVPLGEPTTIQSAFDNTMKVFGRENVELPEDIPRDVLIQFTKTRPITVEMKDGKLWITMRIVELSRAKGAALRRFIVRAGYTAQIDGLRASLVRDGHLNISGPGMSMRQRLPIRAIFNKVFSPNHPIPVTSSSFVSAESLADAEISQIEIRDGWFALAVSKSRPDRIAIGITSPTR